MPKLRICFISPEKKSQFTVRPWVLAEMVWPCLVLFRSLLGSAFVGRTIGKTPVEAWNDCCDGGCLPHGGGVLGVAGHQTSLFPLCLASQHESKADEQDYL